MFSREEEYKYTQGFFRRVREFLKEARGAYLRYVSTITLKKVRAMRKNNKCEIGQDTKGVWWMPRYQEAKKDAASCEKPRGAAS